MLTQEPEGTASTISCTTFVVFCKTGLGSIIFNALPGSQPFSAASTSSSIFLASPKSMRLFSL